jgi:uncharacterized damage-inducible protein DinB
MPISAALLPEFDQEMANTRKVLERLPDERWTWKPHPKSWPLGNLANHVATIPGWATYTIELDQLDVAPVDGPPLPRTIANSQAELLALFDQQVASARKAIEGASDEHLLKPWTLLAAGKTFFTMPRAAVLRSIVMNHHIHHRAQLTMYLRLNDIPMPGMYGPSADEPAVM